MSVLWKKEIDEIRSTGYMKNNISITDALIENFYHEIMKDEEKALMKLVFEKNPKQEELDELLKKWDIEVKKIEKNLLLSYFMKYHPELKFTSYEAPRLKGLLQNVRFKNMQIVSHFVKIVKKLNENNIIPMVLKGGAMKFLRPELPRIMGDIDILVKDKYFMKSIRLAGSLGYYYEKLYSHSVDLHDPKTRKNAIDLHKFIYLKTGCDKKFIPNLWKRAVKHNVFGVSAYVPSNEDMVFISLVNLAKNLRDKTSQSGLLYTLFDCNYFINQPDFNWNIVKENAKMAHAEIPMNFAMKFMNRISSNIIPKEIQNNMPFERETNDYSNVVMYDRFYLEDMRKHSRALKIEDTIKNPELWGEYIKLKPKYYALKQLRNHPRLIETFIKDLKTKEYDFSKK